MNCRAASLLVVVPLALCVLPAATALSDPAPYKIMVTDDLGAGAEVSYSPYGPWTSTGAGASFVTFPIYIRNAGTTTSVTVKSYRWDDYLQDYVEIGGRVLIDPSSITCWDVGKAVLIWGTLIEIGEEALEHLIMEVFLGGFEPAPSLMGSRVERVESGGSCRLRYVATESSSSVSIQVSRNAADTTGTFTILSVASGAHAITSTGSDTGFMGLFGTGDFATYDSFGNLRAYQGSLTGVTEPDIPGILRVRAYPSPSSSWTTVKFGTTLREPVAVKVFDVGGRGVRSLAVAAGGDRALWDGRDEAGHLVDSGVYLINVASGSFHGAARTVIVR